MNDRTPPLARDLNGVDTGYTWNYGESGPAGAGPRGAPREGADEGEDDEVNQLRGQVRHLMGALEDVVALALSGADYKERAIMMHRRAVAALSGVPEKPGGGAQPGGQAPGPRAMGPKREP